MDESSPWVDASILVTGGTGTFGRTFVAIALRELRPRRLVVFSRDELKQHEMRLEFPDADGSGPLRFFIGDVRDRDRLRRAMQGVDLVVHAAALKQVPACEYNPLEAVKTNVGGAENVVDAALDAGVRRVLALSTDKAVNPVNLYGATKLVAEKLFVQANAYAGREGTAFACVRYGNVLGSRGSVVPLFRSQRATGRITLTDPEMTRFWITPEQGVRFVLACAARMRGGEVFVPKMPSMRLADLAEAIAPGCRCETIGVRPGEKLHETLISTDEARAALEFEDHFLIQPLHAWWERPGPAAGRPMAAGASYASDANDRWLTSAELRRTVDETG